MEKPLISVIVVTYNRVDYLELTLNSIKDQTYEPIEIIVVDDGSSNDFSEVLCQKYNDLKYIKIANSGGPCKPRNIGIDLAKGKYVAFLDDDDIWLPNKIAKQVSVLESHNDFGLVHCYCNVIDEKGDLTNKIVGRPGSMDVKHGDVKMKMMGNWTLMMPTPLIKRSIVEKVGYFNENMPQTAADVEYWTRCSFFTKFYYQDLALVHYRKHANNMSSDLRPYVDLPLYLKAILKIQLEQGRVTAAEYKKLLFSLSLSQAKNIKNYPLQTFLNLFEFNPFWMLNFHLLKLMIKKVIS